MNEAVDGVPPLSLSVSGQEAKQWKRKAARLIELLVQPTADLRCLLELTVATEHHAIHKHLDGEKRVFKGGKTHLELAYQTLFKRNIHNIFMMINQNFDREMFVLYRLSHLI